MITTEKTTVTIETSINAPVERVWNYWTEPWHIMHWNQASEDWFTSHAENDLRVGGKFVSRMEARDGSSAFDFAGEYDSVILLKQIKYTLADGRNVKVTFSSEEDHTIVSESFETETIHDVEMQLAGWQSILDNFKRYVEKAAHMEVLHFETLINAPVHNVYTTMTDNKSYSEWTSVFNPTSRFEGSWEKNTKMIFLGDEENGRTMGMIAKIAENIPDRFICLEYIGMIKNGEEVFCGKEVEEWLGGNEKYIFEDQDGRTLLRIEVDADEKFIGYFKETWPKALQKLKSICEQSV
jgi:uncharacterized protein YndB with AHSA1/START domain